MPLYHPNVVFPSNLLPKVNGGINGLNGLKRLNYLITPIIKDIGRVEDIQTVETFLKISLRVEWDGQ
jgi:hypothetical protein